MPRAIWTDRALADLDDIDRFYAALSPGHADRVGRAAIAAGRFLADYPEAGPLAGEGTRKWRVRTTDHLLFYRLHPEGVEILRVHHGRENWKRIP